MSDINFYKSKAWRRKRLYILMRDKYCQECLRRKRLRQANTVHHIKPLEVAPELALVDDNLESLCASCHNILHPEKHGGKAITQEIAGVRVIKI